MKKSSTTFFADTTVVYYKLHGHSLLKEAVRLAVNKDKLVVSNFVRGEYIRGYITGLIDLYSAIKEENSVGDGIAVFNGGVDTRPRKIANALQSAATWLSGLEDYTDVYKTLRRLGEHIRFILDSFDMEFSSRTRDPLECDIGVMSFPRESYDEKHIFDFLEEYEKIRAGPSCNQCGFRKDQEAKLSEANIDLYGEEQKKAHSEARGYIKQTKWIEKAIKSPLTQPSCWYCDRLGDTIIALSAPAPTIILTGDKQSFPVLSRILKKPLQLIPSLPELKNQQGQR